MSSPNTISNKRNWAWLWLAYTGFLFIQPLLRPSARLWVETLLSFAIFVLIFAAYVRASSTHSPVRYWMIAASFALGLLTFPVNRGASTFFIYAAAFLPFAIASLPRVLLLFGVESGIILLEHQLLHLDWPNTLIAIFLVIIIGVGNIFAAEQKRAECRLRAAQEENVALAAVAERERIARDLHDVLGHTLSVIVLKAELAGRLLNQPTSPDTARVAAEIADVERTARTALSEVRDAIGGYRTRGFSAEIEAARHTLDAAGVTLVTEDALAGIEGGVLRASEETVLSLALREAVTNIVRHANATTCRISFVHRDGRRRLLIEDDGREPIVREGNGLRGMRERVESLGGNLRLERVQRNDPAPASPTEGTRLCIDLPAMEAAR